jgi:hypothetical protein
MATYVLFWSYNLDIIKLNVYFVLIVYPVQKIVRNHMGKNTRLCSVTDCRFFLGLKEAFFAGCPSSVLDINIKIRPVMIIWRAA